MTNETVGESEFAGLIEVYDAGDDGVYDRYTVVFLKEPERQEDMFACVGMSEHPFHPQGFGQHSTAMRGPHLGKVISFDQLPPDCQKLVRRDLADEIPSESDRPKG